MSGDGRRNAVVLVTDGHIFPAAAFAAIRLAAMNDRVDTDILVFCNSPADIENARVLSLPFRVLPLIFPPGLKLPPTYYRLFAPVALGATYRRVLYLDVDTYVHGPVLFRLFDIDMGGRAVAAVCDPVVVFRPDERELAFAFGGRHERYFNAGVLLIDTRAYIDGKLLAGMVPMIVDAPLSYLDQSALNKSLDGNWVELSPSFNLFVNSWTSWLPHAFPPVVVHFAGKQKPWYGPELSYDHPAGAEMQRFFPRSPWKAFLSQHDAQKRTMRRLRLAMSYEKLFHRTTDLLRYYRETAFADVEAGLTVRHLEHIPAV